MVCVIVEEMKNYYVDLVKKVNEEIGFGKCEDKVIKNKFVNEFVYDCIKDMKIVGILNEIDIVIEVGVFMGIVVVLILFINLILIVIYKILILLKVGNVIIVSFYLNVKNCVIDIVKLM